jgi:hypothetical protein
MNERKPAEDRELGDLIRAKATRTRRRPRCASAWSRRSATTMRHSRASSGRPRCALVAGRRLAFACGALLSWLALSLGPRTDTSDPGERDIVSAHVRAVMMARAVDIASSDRIR